MRKNLHFRSTLFMGIIAFLIIPVARGFTLPEPATPAESNIEAGAEAPAEPALGATKPTESSTHSESKEGEHAKSGKATGHGSSGDGHSSRYSDEVIPLLVENVPARPKPLLELGEPFLGTGTLAPGFRLPTGAVWQPSLLMFGTLRTALQSNGYSPALGESRTTEVATRLDLFANLQLSGSERLVMGFRNLDRDGRFTSYIVDSDNPALEDGSQEELNAEIGSLFFEGDFGEIFPNISPRDFSPTDIGFSIGRQPMVFQDGLLINDTVDGIGLTWNTLQPRRTSNYRTTFFYGWNNINRGGNPVDAGKLYALFTSIDFQKSTMDIDAAYVSGENGFADVAVAGISAAQRFGFINTTFRILGSSTDTVAGEDRGGILFSEISWTPLRSHNLFYINNFWVVDTFTSASHGPSNGGPLGRAGINFAGVGLGNYGAPLSAAAREVVGGAIGYQMFFDHTRQQLIVEFGTRIGTDPSVIDQYALTGRYQLALARRFVFIMDAFINHSEAFEEDAFFGGRLEFQIRL